MQKSQMGENALSTARGAMVFEPEQKSEDSEELESYPRPFAQKLKAQLLFILNIMQILTPKHVPKKKKKEREKRSVHILGPLCKRRDRSLPVFSVLLGAES